MEFASSILFIFFGLFAGILVDNSVNLREVLKTEIFQWVLCVLCFLTFISAVCLHFYAQREYKKALADSPIFVGEIHPGKNKNPRPLEENQRLLLLGDDLAIITDGSQNSVLSKQGKSFLSIGVDANGLMTLSATVSDSKNNNVVKIINNEFQASQEFAFLPKQPDKNSIIVRDSDGVEVLNVTFINRQTMRITGRFIIPDSSEPIVISNIDGIRWPGGGGISHLTLDIKGQGGVMDFD